MLRSILNIAAAGAAALMAVSCINADTVDGPVAMTAYDIVTFDGNTPGATFSYYAPGVDTPLILRADAALDEDAATPGSRVLLAYTATGEPDASGQPISMSGLGAVTSPQLQGCRGVPQGWDDDPVWLTSVWRAGQYVDMRVRLPYSTEPRRFALMVDSTTLNTPQPRLYLYHRLPEGVSADSTFERTYYVSVAVGSVWNRPEVEAIEVNVANTNLPSRRTFIFKKTNR